MALDRPDDDYEAGEARLEQHLGNDRLRNGELRNGGPGGGDVPAARSEPAEPRTREEYYEALRAADGSSSDHSSSDIPDDGSSSDGSSGGEPHAADSRTNHSGWDSVDAANRPSVDAINVSPEQTTHILDGDSNGGGHRHGIGSPEKTEFPASWDDKKIMNNVLDVAQRPDTPPVLQHWNNRWVCTGTRDSIEISVIVLRSGEVWTAWPEEGSPGVVRNPKKGNHDGN